MKISETASWNFFVELLAPGGEGRIKDAE